jgi:hypothetical protein
MKAIKDNFPELDPHPEDGDKRPKDKRLTETYPLYAQSFFSDGKLTFFSLGGAMERSERPSIASVSEDTEQHESHK